MTVNQCSKSDQYCLQKQHIEATRKILVVLMISLFFISAILLLIYFYTKFYLRRQVHRRAAIRQASMNTLASVVHSTTEPPVETTGLDPSALALLPVFLYKVQEGQTRQECAVCLSNIEEEEIARLLPNCNHMFHAKCVDEWLSRHTNCPVCRTEAKPTARPSEPKWVLKVWSRD